MKTTSNERWPQKINNGISQKPLIGSSSNFRIKLRGENQKWTMVEMNKTSNRRRPQNISGISQQPQGVSYLNLKLKLIWPNQNWKLFEFEDELKRLKVKYLFLKF